MTWIGTKAVWLVLLISMGATISGWYIANKVANVNTHKIFEARNAEVLTEIRQRLHTCEFLLQSGKGLFAATKSVSRNDFHNFVSSLKLDQHVKGIVGVVYAEHIVPEKKDVIIKKIRVDGAPDFNIKPLGQRSEYAPIVLLEDFTNSSISLLGFDLYTEPMRLNAMERARDSGDITLSSKVRLLRTASGKEGDGALMFIPVYQNGQLHKTTSERRSALTGYFYIPFRTNELMDNLLEREAPDLDIKIFDGNKIDASALLYETISDSDANQKHVPRYAVVSKIEMYDHQWTVYAGSTPIFENETSDNHPMIILILGSVISLALFVIALTQKELNEKALYEVGEATSAFKISESKLQAILDQSPIVFWVLDKNLNFTLVKGASLEVLKQSPEDIVGKSLHYLWDRGFLLEPHSSHPLWLAANNALLGNATELDVELQGHWFQNSIKPMKDEQGKVTGVFGVSFDITSRKNAKRALDRMGRLYKLLSMVNESVVRIQNQNELFKAICTAAVESELFVFAWVGVLNEKDRFVRVDTHAGKELGYLKKLNINLDDDSGNGPTGIALRTNAHIICQDIEHDSKMNIWRDEAIKRGYKSSGVFPIRASKGTKGVITVYAAEIDFFTPDIVKVMLELATDSSFALDVIAEKEHREVAEIEIRKLNLELEQRVRQRTNQLEVINNELESFSYSVSHDLRAPLRSIDGFSQILLNRYQSMLDETGKDYLQRVRRASQRMGNLIDDLIKLSRVTRGDFKREIVDLSLLAKNVSDELLKLHPERKVKFILQPGLSVYADPGLVMIVMDNLLGNAFKFTGKKEYSEIEFGQCVINGENTFFIRDNGAGFDMTYAHKLFGAFQRLHNVSDFDGTGIGLATVRRIINGHNGKVWAEAKEGEGAVFYFTLPQKLV